MPISKETQKMMERMHASLKPFLDQSLDATAVPRIRDTLLQVLASDSVPREALSFDVVPHPDRPGVIEVVATNFSTRRS